MYIKDGVVYAREPMEELEVESVRYVGDRILIVTFNTGETRLFDATCLLEFPAFAPLADDAVLTDYSIDHGVLTWSDGDIDIAPEYLYERSCEYEFVA